MTQPIRKYYTVEEYLALEDAAPYKSEYYQGEIYAMAGTSLNHNRIVVNTCNALVQMLAGKLCEPFMSDIRLGVKTKSLYTYPDIFVVCGKPIMDEKSPITITNPTVIVEVLSDPTAEYERTTKFELYKSLTSFLNYILIDQHRAYIQSLHRLEESRFWAIESYSELTENLFIPALNLQIPLHQIYGRVEWPETPSSSNYPVA